MGGGRKEWGEWGRKEKGWVGVGVGVGRKGWIGAGVGGAS